MGAGDFDAAEMKRIVERTLGQWQVAPGQPAEPLQVPNPPLPPTAFAGQVHSRPQTLKPVIMAGCFRAGW